VSTNGSLALTTHSQDDHTALSLTTRRREHARSEMSVATEKIGADVCVLATRLSSCVLASGGVSAGGVWKSTQAYVCLCVLVRPRLASRLVATTVRVSTQQQQLSSMSF
jgi:hypothetical protein